MMKRSLFLLVLLSMVIVISPVIVMAQTNVGVETEVGVKVGSESDVESSAQAETKTKVEVKSETKSSEESKQESTQQTETKSQTSVENIGVTTKGVIKSSIGLPTKYTMPEASAKSSIVIQTNQHLYKPGDKVTITGSLWVELLADLSNNNVVTIKVFDKTNNLIYEADAQVDANGNYSTEFSLPKSASKGSYAVTSDINLKGDVAGLIGVQGQTSIGSNVKIAVVPPQVFKVKVENHGDFDIQVATNSTVQNVDFNVEQKKVSVTVEGESGTKGVSHISIPKAMVSGDMTVMIDGKVVPSDKVVVTSNTELETEVEVNYNHSVHTIDIVGTQAVPEFGAITMMILVVAIISIVAITAKTRIIPRF